MHLIFLILKRERSVEKKAKKNSLVEKADDFQIDQNLVCLAETTQDCKSEAWSLFSPNFPKFRSLYLHSTVASV